MMCNIVFSITYFYGHFKRKQNELGFDIQRIKVNNAQCLYFKACFIASYGNLRTKSWKKLGYYTDI